jgi:hypothetical protein
VLAAAAGARTLGPVWFARHAGDALGDADGDDVGNMFVGDALGDALGDVLGDALGEAVGGTAGGGIAGGDAGGKHAVDVQTKLLSPWHPVPQQTAWYSSSKVHSRAPCKAHSVTAAARSMSSAPPVIGSSVIG